MHTTISKRFHFSASHKLCNPSLSPEENKQLFGDCNRQHGHNFVLEVIVAGPIDSRSGMIINFHELKQVVNDHIIHYLDHKDFDRDIPELADTVHTAENLIHFIWNRLAPNFSNSVRLKKLRLAETNDNWVELEE